MLGNNISELVTTFWSLHLISPFILFFFLFLVVWS